VLVVAGLVRGRDLVLVVAGPERGRDLVLVVAEPERGRGLVIEGVVLVVPMRLLHLALK
jgi:hypothetical protein